MVLFKVGQQLILCNLPQLGERRVHWDMGYDEIIEFKRKQLNCKFRIFYILCIITFYISFSKIFSISKDLVRQK